MSVLVKPIPQRTTRVDLAGQVAIITGGAGGIGLGIARGLAETGATVVIGGRNLEATRLAAHSAQSSGRVEPIQVDVTDEASVSRMVASVLNEFGRIDILINNAATSTDAIVEETTAEEWRSVIDVNLTGPFLCSKAVMPSMAAAGYGRIVNIGSIASQRISNTHGASYTAAKAGLLGFTRHFAYEVAGRGVTVNVVNPGATLTPEIAERWSEETLKARERSVPRGRIAQPEDILRVVLFLVSDLADLVCGQAIDIDSGALLGWYDTETYFRQRGAETATH